MVTEKNSATAQVLFAEARKYAMQLFESIDKFNEIRDVLVGMGYSIPRDKQAEDWGQDWPIPELALMGNGCSTPERDFLDAFWQSGPMETQTEATIATPRRLSLAKERTRLGTASGWACFYCHFAGTAEVGPDNRGWHVDHVYPVVNGGDDGPDNHVLSCATCNLEKSAHSAVEHFRKKAGV